MAANGDANRVSLADANERGVAELVREAEEGRQQIIVRDGKPVAVVISAERYEQLQRLQDDLIDITLVAARMLTDSGPRYTLDEVLERLGYTREELADATEARRAESQSEPLARAQGGFRSVDRETHPLIGRWRIVEMDLWDRDYLDLVEPPLSSSPRVARVSSPSASSPPGSTAAIPRAASTSPGKAAMRETTCMVTGGPSCKTMAP